MNDTKSFILNDNFKRRVLFSPGIYPLASIALASSIARLNEITNIGTSKEIICPICSCSFPSLKSTPLDACAFSILFVSLNKVGIKRKAMETIIAKIDGLSFISSSGFKYHSMALAKSIGFVVNVSVVAIIMIAKTLNIIKAAYLRPSSYIYKVGVAKGFTPIGNVNKYKLSIASPIKKNIL